MKKLPGKCDSLYLSYGALEKFIKEYRAVKVSDSCIRCWRHLVYVASFNN